MAMPNKDLFDKLLKEIGPKILGDITAPFSTDFNMSNDTGSEMQELKKPDESYKTGPWLHHIRPKFGGSGFEQCCVCASCMIIGDILFNDEICKFCGAKDKRKIVAIWVWDIWILKGHWESCDA